MASPTVIAFRVDGIPRRRNLPCPDDRRQGTAPAALALIRPPRRSRRGGLLQHGRRVCRNSRVDSNRLVMVREPRLRVSRPRPVLAGFADDRPVLLGNSDLSRTACPPQYGTHGQYALAVLFFGALD